MKSILTALSAAVLLCSSAYSQNDLNPKFEAADIRTAPRSAKESGGVAPTGRIELHGITMLTLLVRAYGVDNPKKIAGGPGWLDSDRFDLTIKARPVTSQAALGEVLQAVLADRFK